MEPIFNIINSTLIASGCNNICRHCSMSAEANERILLSLDEISDLFEQFYKANMDSPPLFEKLNVLISYEPSIHPDIASIWDLIASVPHTSRSVEVMATNGSGIANAEDHNALLDKLKNSGLRTIQLSPYGLENTHDWFARRKGAFQDLMLSAQRSIESGFMINWQYILHKRNVYEIPELINYIHKIVGYGSFEESIAIVAASGRGRDIENLRIDIDDLKMLPKEIREMKFLPDYRSETEWIEEAISRRMDDILREYFQEIGKNEYPELFLNFNKQNINRVSEIINESRHRKTPKRIDEDIFKPDLKWLAQKYGDKENRAIYNASMMRNKWLKLHFSQ